jgi:leucyl aminopeptidase
MQFSVNTGRPESHTGACTIIGVFDDRKLDTSAAAIDKTSDGYISALLQSGAFSGKIGQTLLLFKVPKLACGAVLLAGLGSRDEFGAKSLRKATAAAVTTLAGHGITSALSTLSLISAGGLDPYWRVRHSVEAAGDAAYNFNRCKSKPDDETPVESIAFAVAEKAGDAAELGIRHGGAIAAGAALVKELGNLPPNICTPSYLAQQAHELASRHKKVAVDVIEEEQMRELGMGALLAVSRGSREPAKLIVMHYQGAAKTKKPLALVGKGITFDAGGISLKPPAAMDEMKFDMCGAATVFGALEAAAELELPINLIGVVASSENLPDGAANKPGDILTTMSGQTVEVLNTDAEGRLVLCDALTYTERFEPETVVDMATLTGACVIALGAHAHGLFGNDEALVRELLAAGEKTGDRAWQLPLWDDYQEQLKSNFADFANVGGREAGSITAACFLSRFTKKFRWAHLDIAGTAWLSGPKKGATGRPLGLVMQYLLSKAE